MGKVRELPSVSEEQVAIFAQIFEGSNGNNAPRWVPKNFGGKGEHFEDKDKGQTLEDIRTHLQGTGFGAGSRPVKSDRCRFGVIDIDFKSKASSTKGESVDVVEVDRRVQDAGLPLIVCQSKSGAAHLFLFCDTAVEAKLVFELLVSFRRRIGYLDNHVDYRPQLGEPSRWINLPYYQACEIKAGDPEAMRLDYGPHRRFAVHKGQVLDLNGFLALVKQKTQTRDDLMKWEPEAPPCVQNCYQRGLTSGDRNEMLCTITNYEFHKDPEAYRDRVREFNARMVKPAYGSAGDEKGGLNALMDRVRRSSLRYHCDGSAMRERCVESECKSRILGRDQIEDNPKAKTRTNVAAKKAEAEAGLAASFEDLAMTKVLKYLATDQWVLVFGDKHVPIKFMDLMDPKRFAIIVGNAILKPVPYCKPSTWQDVAVPRLMAMVEEVEHIQPDSGAVVMQPLEYKITTEAMIAIVTHARPIATAEKAFKAWMQGSYAIWFVDEKYFLVEPRSLENLLKRGDKFAFTRETFYTAMARISTQVTHGAIMGWRVEASNPFIHATIQARAEAKAERATKQATQAKFNPEEEIS